MLPSSNSAEFYTSDLATLAQLTGISEAINMQKKNEKKALFSDMI